MGTDVRFSCFSCGYSRSFHDGRGFHDPYAQETTGLVEEIKSAIRRKVLRDHLIELVQHHHGQVSDFGWRALRCEVCGKLLNAQVLTLTFDQGIYITPYLCHAKAMTEIDPEDLHAFMKTCPRCGEPLSENLFVMWD